MTNVPHGRQTTVKLQLTSDGRIPATSDVKQGYYIAACPMFLVEEAQEDTFYFKGNYFKGKNPTIENTNAVVIAPAPVLTKSAKQRERYRKQGAARKPAAAAPAAPAAAIPLKPSPDPIPESTSQRKNGSSPIEEENKNEKVQRGTKLDPQTLILFVSANRGLTNPEIRQALHRQGYAFDKKQLNKMLHDHCDHSAIGDYKRWFPFESSIQSKSTL